VRNSRIGSTILNSLTSESDALSTPFDIDIDQKNYKWNQYRYNVAAVLEKIFARCHFVNFTNCMSTQLYMSMQEN